MPSGKVTKKAVSRGASLRLPAELEDIPFSVEHLACPPFPAPWKAHARTSATQSFTYYGFTQWDVLMGLANLIRTAPDKHGSAKDATRPVRIKNKSNLQREVRRGRRTT